MAATPGVVETPGAGQGFLEMRGIQKRYGGVHALRGVDFTVSAPGVVHGLLGENGSGKSSLLGVISGQVSADEGQILLSGEEVRFHNAPDALAKGIAMVSQETAVAPELSVAENVLMGRLPRSGAGIQWQRARSQSAEVLARLGLEIDPGAPVGTLPPDHRQMIEIARALASEPRVLILDEPTSTLTEDEVESVLKAIVKLKTQDVATVIVSHRLEELFAVIDEATVLRDGQVVAAARRDAFTMRSMVSAMLGSEEAIPESRAVPPTANHSRDSQPTLRADGATASGFSGLSLDVHPGEIVGLGGLLGSGRSEILRAIFGLCPLDGGTMELGGRGYAPSSPGDAVAHRVGYVPPDRKTDGLVLQMSVRENLRMVATAHARSWPFRSNGNGKDYRQLLSRLRVRDSALVEPAGNLSGGNQQKIALAKWLIAGVDLLLLDEPTRGVDVGARAQIHEILRELADEGVSVLVSSSENLELLELCDRVVVLFAGRETASLPTEGLTESELSHYCSGQAEERET